MASSVPYAAPYSRTAPRARPSVNLNSQPARFAGIGLAIALFYTLIQLALAGMASGTLTELASLEKAIALARLERDTLIVQVEDLKNPVRVEDWAVRNGYAPATNIEFVP